MKQDLKNQILSAVSQDLLAIEAALHDNLTPQLDLVSAIAGHLLFSGGKRLRPLLFVLSARLCGHDKSDAASFSTLFEYLHAATLLHDDVVDQAAVRRGKEVAHVRWGAPEVVLTGDFLLARSLSLAAATGLPELISVIAGITEDMSQGEIDQLSRKGDIRLSEADYMEIIRRKTAVLIQGACRSGAIIARAPKDREEALNAYGYHLGMAFQMADDLLDYTADAKTLGKNPGADLREGKLTLPLITALKNAGPADRSWMETFIQGSEFNETDFRRLVETLTLYDGIGYTRAKAEEHAGLAKASLNRFDPSTGKDVMLLLTDYAVARQH
ncbi:MAG: polyprenyl synthetase family protein [Pseudomonadota bacterium]